MNPKAAVAVLLLMPGLAAAAEPASYEQGLAKARQAYLTHEQGKPTLDAVAKLSAPQDPAKKQEFAVISAALESAKDVQLGCAAPCASAADVQVYSGKVELTARKLGLKDAEVQAALKHYLPQGKPRIRAGGAAQTPGGQAMEAEVIARMLADGKMSPQLRTALNAKALAMAAALGRTQTLKADADGVVTMPDGQRARLTAAQIAQLNAIPQTQAQILRNLATKAPPPPMTAQQRQDAALAEAEKAIQENPGTIGETYNFWKREAADPKSSWAWRAYAKTNMGLLTFSGLKAVEESSARLGYVWDNPDVSKGEKFWLGTKLGGNMALSFVTFLPAAAVAKELTGSVQAGAAVAAESGSVVSGTVAGLKAAKNSFYWINKGGKAVEGMAAATPEAAQAMTAASKTLTQTIVKALPEGAGAGKAELRTLITGLNEKAARYGVEVIEGGTTGESVAKGGKIFVSLKAGAQHETVHVVQQVFSRVTALEEMAARTGTTVEGLSAAQRAEAFANAAKWETASYAQLESQAYRATGFMGMGGGSQYTRQLLMTGQEVSSGMRNGEVLDGSFSLGQRFYGRLTQWVGHSQGEILKGLGSTGAGVTQGALFDPTREMVEGAVRPYTAPVEKPATPLPLLR